ncbi:MAG: hypothetical protein GY784_18905 [Gammaproteobacteria bacterium]|nr:hypothetical protein [Gammaproteobacteria bacterium]
MSTTGGENKSRHRVFKGRRERTRRRRCGAAFPEDRALSPRNAIQGPACSVNEKRQLSLGLSQSSPVSACVAAQYPRPGAGILTRFPFDSRGTEMPASERPSPIS